MSRLEDCPSKDAVASSPVDPENRTVPNFVPNFTTALPRIDTVASSPAGLDRGASLGVTSSVSRKIEVLRWFENLSGKLNCEGAVLSNYILEVLVGLLGHGFVDNTDELGREFPEIAQHLEREYEAFKGEGSLTERQSRCFTLAKRSFDAFIQRKSIGLAVPVWGRPIFIPRELARGEPGAYYPVTFILDEEDDIDVVRSIIHENLHLNSAAMKSRIAEGATDLLTEMIYPEAAQRGYYVKEQAFAHELCLIMEEQAFLDFYFSTGFPGLIPYIGSRLVRIFEFLELAVIMTNYTGNAELYSRLLAHRDKDEVLDRIWEKFMQKMREVRALPVIRGRTNIAEELFQIIEEELQSSENRDGSDSYPAAPSLAESNNQIKFQSPIWFQDLPGFIEWYFPTGARFLKSYACWYVYSFFGIFRIVGPHPFFGSGGGHDGLDFAFYLSRGLLGIKRLQRIKAGTPVRAIADGIAEGVVEYEVNSNSDPYLSQITIRHNSDYKSRYGHTIPSVNNDQTVTQGQQIGIVANSYVRGWEPHLHLDISVKTGRFESDKKFFDPLSLIEGLKRLRSINRG